MRLHICKPQGIKKKEQKEISGAIYHWGTAFGWNEPFKMADIQPDFGVTLEETTVLAVCRFCMVSLKLRVDIISDTIAYGIAPKNPTGTFIFFRLLES